MGSHYPPLYGHQVWHTPDPWIIETPLSLPSKHSPPCHRIASGSPGARVVPGSGSLPWHVSLTIALFGTRRRCAPLPHGLCGRGAPQGILPVVVALVRLALFWAELHPIAPRVLSLQASGPGVLPLNASLGILSLHPCTVPRILPLQAHSRVLPLHLLALHRIPKSPSSLLAEEKKVKQVKIG